MNIVVIWFGAVDYTMYYTVSYFVLIGLEQAIWLIPLQHYSTPLFHDLYFGVEYVIEHLIGIVYCNNNCFPSLRFS